MHKIHFFFMYYQLQVFHYSDTKMVKQNLERICYASVLGILKNILAISASSSVSDCQQGQSHLGEY